MAWQREPRPGSVVPQESSASDSDGERHAPRRLVSFASFGLLAMVLVGAAAYFAHDHTLHIATSSYDSAVQLDSTEGEDDEKDASADSEDDGSEDEEEKSDKKDKSADKEKDNTKKCSWGKENCNATKCCNNPGEKCYEQGAWYAQCRVSCAEGVDVTHWDASPWTCKELGERSPGEGGCAELGEDCRKKGCCSTMNTQCFEKNDDWATCKSECIEGAPDLADSNGDPWSCKTIGEWTKGAADWVAEKCTQPGEECSQTGCCALPGMKCWKQSDYWAQCAYDCPDGWGCDSIGVRTPAGGGLVATSVGSWVAETCADEWEDCSKSKCCLNTNTQCFAKNKDWGVCLETCEAGTHKDDKNETWSCDPLGPRLMSGLAVKGSPSLFCWVLFQTTTYENDIVQLQLKEDAGVFQCDEYALLSTDAETVMGKVKGSKKEIKTIKVEKAEITTSVDGTAGNAKLFINCWNAIIDDKRWKHHAWIIKVDPDAVIVPWRVRDHLRDHVLENVYLVNCNKFPSSPNFPMMYGSVEIYSFLAIQTYANKMGQCMDDMGMMLPQWGEDYFMTHCLDHIGVGRISDFTSVGDNVCSGGACSDQAFSAFHPFKDAGAWKECWDEVNGKAPPEPEWAQQQW